MDLTGQRYGRLTVVGLRETRNYIKRYECRCDCGNITVVDGRNLTSGHTTSCGCLKREIIAAGTNTKHGGKGSRLYGIWKDMRRRCNSPSRKNYGRYGGRGITVCEEWEDFAAFRDWAISAGYTDDLTLDRIDNDKGYSPENCRWTTPKRQSNNRSSNHYIEHGGQRRTISEWSEVTGISPGLICQRLRLGWSAERTLTQPVRDH